MAAPPMLCRGFEYSFTTRDLVEAIISEERTRAAERQAIGGMAETALREHQLRNSLAWHEQGALSKTKFLATVLRIADSEAVRRAIVVLTLASDDATVKDHLKIKASPPTRPPTTAAALPPEKSPAAPLMGLHAHPLDSSCFMSRLELHMPLPPAKRARSKP